MFEFVTGVWRPAEGVRVEVVPVPTDRPPHTLVLASPGMALVLHARGGSSLTGVAGLPAAPIQPGDRVLLFVPSSFDTVVQLGGLTGSDGQPAQLRCRLTLAVSDPVTLAGKLAPGKTELTADDLGRMLAGESAFHLVARRAMRLSEAGLVSALAADLTEALELVGLRLEAPPADVRILRGAGAGAAVQPGVLGEGRPPSTAISRADSTMSTPRHVDIRPDGRGDYPTLDEAIRQVPAGTTIVLAAGEYRLSRPLRVTRALMLLGAGMDQTRLVCASPGQVVLFEGSGPFGARGVTFVHEGGEVGDVVVVAGGSVDFQHCRFGGAVYDPDTDTGGAGLWLEGDARGTVRDCIASSNDDGIRVSYQAQPTLEANTCEQNKNNGIAYVGTASGSARNNTCRANGAYGIAVGERAGPTLDTNTCERNKQGGIAYVGLAAGTARNNICRDNSNSGIFVGEQAQPTLEANTCEQNKYNGITYGGSAAGTARNNTCRVNSNSGIFVGEDAQPILEANACEKNEMAGIAYVGTASGTARNNTCRANELCGILANDEAQPTLEANTCEQNKSHGIAYFGSAAGTARNNTCRANGQAGIAVGERAGPTLDANTCERNKSHGITYAGSAAGTVRNNTCRANELCGISVDEEAQPTLDANTSERNKRAGIGYFGTAAGTARQNTCRANETEGILVLEQAHPTLEANTCEQNETVGIAYFGSGAGTACNNTCRANAHWGIYVDEQAAPTLEGNTCMENTDGPLYVASTARPILEKAQRKARKWWQG